MRRNESLFFCDYTKYAVFLRRFVLNIIMFYFIPLLNRDGKMLSNNIVVVQYFGDRLPCSDVPWMTLETNLLTKRQAPMIFPLLKSIVFALKNALLSVNFGVLLAGPANHSIS